MNDGLIIAGKALRSRLFLGTGKYRDAAEMTAALDASGSELITVAIRRLNLDNPDERTLLDEIDWTRYSILPNTARLPNSRRRRYSPRQAGACYGAFGLDKRSSK